MAVVTTTTDASVVATDLPAGRYVDWGPIIVGTWVRLPSWSY